MPVPLTWLLLHFGHIPSCPLGGLVPFGTLWVGTAPAMPGSTGDVPGPLPWWRQQLPRDGGFAAAVGSGDKGSWGRAVPEPALGMGIGLS